MDRNSRVSFRGDSFRMKIEPEDYVMANTKPVAQSSGSNESVSDLAAVDRMCRDDQLVEPHESPVFFTQFAKLPAEIRSMIWQATFANQKHVFNLACCQIANMGQIRRPGAFRPVSLHVNQESRNEAFKHYFLLQFPHDTHRNPIYINPSIDTLSISSVYLARRSESRVMMKKIHSRHREFFHKATSIVLHDVIPGTRPLLSYYQLNWLRDRVWFFKYFTNLQEVRLDMEEHTTLLAFAALRDMKAKLQNFYAVLQQANPEISVPRVVIYLRWLEREA